MCYCTVFALFYFEFEGNFRVQSISIGAFLRSSKKAFVKYQTIGYPASSSFSRPDAALGKERNHCGTKQL